MIDQYELLELFESLPRIIDEEVGIYEYTRRDSYGFKLEMYVCLSEQRVSLSLWYKDFLTPIFDLGFDQIDKIVCKENRRLILKQSVNKKNIIVQFTPNYSLAFETPLE